MNPKTDYTLTYASGLAVALPLFNALAHTRTITASEIFDFEYQSCLPDEIHQFIQNNKKALEDNFNEYSKWIVGASKSNSSNTDRLQGILSNVSGGKGESWYPVSIFRPEDPENSFFPRQELPSGDWKTVNESFTAECLKIKASSVSEWISLFENLILKYTAHAPWILSDTKDVPMLESIRLTAALMATMETGSKVLLIGADLSGIQSYLFDIQSKNAAKLLKGRSFYLHLFTDAILRRILNDNGWLNGHVIYSTAGGFYLLAADLPETRAQLENFRKELLQANYKAHGEKLYPALAWVSSDGTKLKEGQASEIFRELSEALNIEKRRPYHGVMTGILAGNITNASKEDLSEIEGDNYNYRNKSLYKQQQLLGKQLLGADGLAVWYKADGEVEGIQPGGLGITYRPYIKRDLPDRPDMLLAFNTIYTETHSVPVHTEWYGGNRYPNERGRPLTYDELAGKGEEKFSRLGILRMDVDNLGSIFISGLPEGKRTLARYAFISRTLDQFFKLYLNYLHQSDKRQYKDWTQILYAGGDDLFILGRWDVILAFAKEIRDDFKRYCGKNPALSLSGGVVLVPGKFPIIQAAQWAGEQEDSAKNYKFEKREKDAIGIFDFGLSWENEWQIVQEMKDLLEQYMDHGQNRSIIQRLFNYYRIANYHKLSGKTTKPDLRWRWQMAYDFSRIRQKGQEENLHKIRNAATANAWNGHPIQSKEDGLTLLTIAARILEFETRNT
jgi:CRISPR-associated protein Csm1